MLILPIVVAMLSLDSCSATDDGRCPLCGRQICVCDSYNNAPGQDGDTPLVPTGSDYIVLRDGKMIAPDGSEARLWGVNFQTPISWEYNRLSRVGVSKTAAALRNVADSNLEDLSLMGVNHLRCHLTPADFTDGKGNVDESSVYMDAMDYMVSEAGKRGMYVSFAFLNHMGQSGPGTAWIGGERGTWIQDEATVECVKNYVRQLVNHVNVYTGKAYKDTENIAFWELINEPEMFSYNKIKSQPCVSAYEAWLVSAGKEDSAENYAVFREETVRSYIDGLKSLLREEGDGHLVCWGLNWHRYRSGNEDIFRGVASSNADIVAFCNYPGQDNVSQSYWDNTYNFTDTDFSQWFKTQIADESGYGWTVTDDFSSKAKIVYEFETFFNQSAYLYPVQATFFRSLMVQSASMWTYTFNEIAPYMGGSHYLNLKTTPGKAAAFMVAGEIFRNLPYRTDFSSSPNEQSGDNYVISKSHGGAVWSDSGKYINSCPVDDAWNPVAASPEVKEVAGVGDSPLVKYTGTGIYFIKEVSGELFITLMPDVNVVGDIFSGATYGAAKTVLGTAEKNDLKILLSAWENTGATLYKIGESGNRQSMGHVGGTANLKLAPGKYVVVPEQN